MTNITTFLACLMSLIMTTSAFAKTSETMTSGGFQYRIANVPQWVVTQPLPVPKSIQTQGSQYLLSDEQLNLTNQNYDSFFRIAQKVTTEQGLEQASKVSITFNPEFQTFTLHNILVHRGSTTLDLTHSSKIELFQREEQVNNNIYDGKVTVFIVIPDIRVGDIVEYSSTTKGKNPVFGDHNFATFSLGWSVAVQNSYMRLLTDITRPLHFKVHKHDGKPTVTNEKATIAYTWQQQDIPAIINEQNSPTGFNPYPYVEFTEFDDWKSVVDWALVHYQPQTSKSKTLTKFISETKSTTKTTKEFIEAAIRFVQNDVRYFGIETGQNSHIPSAPGEVFDRRYGDCKDKTMLLNYLLSHVGVTAYPALIAAHARGTIAENLPSPGHFDHVITYFNFNQQDYWIDGTRTFQYGELDNIGVSNFEQALIINHQQTALTPVVMRAQHRSQIHIQETFTARGDYSEPVDLNVSIEFASHEAEYLRSALAAQTAEEFTKHYLDFYSKHFPLIKTLQAIAITDNEVANSITLQGQFEITKFWQSENNRVTTPLYGEFISSYAQQPATIQRKFPLGLYHPIEISQSIQVIFPEAVEWSFERNPLSIENEAIFYNREISFDKKRLSVVHTYKTKTDEVAPKQVPHYVKDIKKIRDALYLSVYNSMNASSSIRTVIRNLLNRKIAEQ